MCMHDEAKMEELRKKDSVFSEMVSIIEGKIEKQIDSYNNTKKINPGWENGVSIKIYVPAFPMTPIQKTCLLTYLCNKYSGKTCHDSFKLKKCILSRRYKIESYTWYIY